LGIAGRKGLDLGLVYRRLQMLPIGVCRRGRAAPTDDLLGSVLLTFGHAVSLALTVSGPAIPAGYGAPSIPYARSTWS
jgi:hypothetical protein